MRVEVVWKIIDEDDDELDFCRVLYAYVHPQRDEILYIGKADRSSVKDRLKGEHKIGVFDYLENEFVVEEIDLIVGELQIPLENRYSSGLLSDIESLLIFELRPPANIQAISNRISRPGLVVVCEGDWPSAHDEFTDQG